MKTINTYISLNEKISSLDDYIQERLHITKDTGEHEYNYHPKTRDELKELVKDLIKERGNDADLNDIDTSEITNMWGIFYSLPFNGDISKWDVSNVKDMSSMFNNSKFTGENGDIFNWNVSKVEDMECMFADSKFNGDISKWNVRSVENMEAMFSGSKFTGENGDISKWNISNVKFMGRMFYKSEFNGDISDWNVSNLTNMYNMFKGSPLEKNPPKWYKE